MTFLLGALLTVLFVLWYVPPEECPRRWYLVGYAYTLFATVEAVASLMF